MKTHSPEERFLRYRDRGDVEALGEVFDWAAPELMRTGAYLARDPLAAEDLLQSTFLTAIERALSYDGDRPLMPWLIGILANHARRWRGRRTTAPLSNLEAEARQADPAARLGFAELGAALTEEIDRLERPEREVLLLSILHGMGPAQIALALDRSPSTVRSQLHRGRVRLQDKLPRSLAPPAVILAGGESEGACLDIRSKILERAVGRPLVSSPLSTTASVGGSGAAGWLGVAMVALVASSLGLVYWLQSQAPTDWTRIQPSSPIPDRANAAIGTPTPLESSIRVASRTVLASEPAERPAPETEIDYDPLPSEAQFEAIVVDPSGDPVANASIELISLGVRGDWSAPRDQGRPQQTDTQGRAVFTFPRQVADGTLVDGLSFSIWCQGYRIERTGPVNTIPEVQRFVLHPACTVVITAYIDSPNELISFDLPRISRSAGLFEREGAWQALGQGMGSNQIVPGQHELLLVHVGSDGAQYFSDPIVFDATLDEVVELHIQLRPARVVCGEIDPSVPRPVRDGVVTVHLVNPPRRPGSSRGRAHVDRVHYESTTSIQSDGSFCFGLGNGLPPIPGDIDAACDGWVASLSTIRRRNAASGTALAELFNERMMLCEDAQEAQIPMQPCGSLSMIATDPDGERIPGVEFRTPPDYDRKDTCAIPRIPSLAATTGTDGIAHFNGIAPGWTSFIADHPTLDLPLEKGARRLYFRRKTVRVEPEQALTVEVQFE